MLNEKQVKKLEVLNRRKRHLENSKECLLENLKPILEDLEKIRISIDEIEIENKYGSQKVFRANSR
jgi:hypothetical protein